MNRYFFLALNIIFNYLILCAEPALKEGNVISCGGRDGQLHSRQLRSSVDDPVRVERQNGIDYINTLRKGAKLIPFNSNTFLDIATQNHIDYLIKHNLFTHIEDNVTFPDGFTGVHSWDRGVAAGYEWKPGKPYSEVISAGNSDIYDSVDSHFSAVYHRFSLLSLKTIDLGVGFARDSNYKYGSAYGFNMSNESNITKAYQANPKYVFWPRANYDKAQTSFSNCEEPRPIPGCAEGGVTANPISIEFNPEKNSHISMDSFRLYSLVGDKIGNTKILNAENDPAGKLNGYQFVLFSMASLDINRWYRVDFSYLESETNKTISWYFKTRSYPYDGYRVVKSRQYDVVSKKSYLLQIKPDDCNVSINNGYRYFGAPVTVERLEYDLFKVTANSTTIGDITSFDFYNGMTFSIRVASKDSAESLSDQSVLTKITDLQSDLNETSGMININGRLFVHNDSGGMPCLYEIDATLGTIKRIIAIEGAENIDWEDLASDDTHVYIADIGNGMGSRRDLKIYKILKHDLLTMNTVSAEEINISYADQTDFSYSSFTTPYDAEAVVVFNGKLYIFTKNWADYTTAVYSVPTIPGSYRLNPLYKKQFEVMVTGADYDPATNSLVLVGYSKPDSAGKSFKSMIIMLSDFKDDDFFSGRIVASEIKNKTETIQVESVLFYGKDKLYIVSEGVEMDSFMFPARLFKSYISPVFRPLKCSGAVSLGQCKQSGSTPVLFYLLD